MKIRFVSIDTLKFFMCFAVVLFHYRCSFLGGAQSDLGRIPFAKVIFLYGDHAVEFFFMISGFLIAHSCKFIPQCPFGSFMKRRVRAVAVPTILAELLAGAAVPGIRKIMIGSWGGVPNFYKWFQSITFSATGYADGIGAYPIAVATWYINVLLLLYALFWIVNECRRRRPSLYIPAVVALIFIGYICIYYFNVPLLWHVNGRGLCSFFVGVLLYEFQTEGTKWNKSRIAATGALASILWGYMGHRYDYVKVFGNIRTSLIFFVYPVLILSALNLSVLKTCLEHPVWKRINHLSAPIYFSHVITFNLIQTIYTYLKLEVSFYEGGMILFCLMIVVINAVIFNFLTHGFSKCLNLLKNFYLVSDSVQKVE